MRTDDGRVQKSQSRLRTALSNLAREKPYGDIVVKEILHRANVSRSTFYAHFDDKDALFRSCIQNLLPPAQNDDVLWFSLPFLEHIEAHRRQGDAVVAPVSRAAMHDQLEAAIAKLIKQGVATPPGWARSDPAARELLVRWIAATFVLTVNWWVDIANDRNALEVDRIFRSLIGPALCS